MKKLSHDIKRYFVLLEQPNTFSKVYLFAFCPGIWVTISYRFGRWVRNDCKVPLIKQLLKIITLFFHWGICLLTGIELPFQSQIGRGFHVSHFGGIIISPKAVIGEYCNIGPGVVVGQGGRRKDKGVPVIGNYVYMGSGAKIFGKITIGNNVAIGANAVVIKDVPDNATVTGIPGKVINFNGSSDFITLE